MINLQNTETRVDELLLEINTMISVLKAHDLDIRTREIDEFWYMQEAEELTILKSKLSGGNEQLRALSGTKCKLDNIKIKNDKQILLRLNFN